MDAADIRQPPEPRVEDAQLPLLAALGTGRPTNLGGGASLDCAQHLGGAVFLFLRGMVGGSTPLRGGIRDGVCAWRPSIAAVLAADAVLAGAHRAGER